MKQELTAVSMRVAALMRLMPLNREVIELDKEVRALAMKLAMPPPTWNPAPATAPTWDRKTYMRGYMSDYRKAGRMGVPVEEIEKSNAKAANLSLEAYRSARTQQASEKIRKS